MIAFKQYGTILEWVDTHPKLRDVLLWLDPEWPFAVMVVTRIFDPPMLNETGVHRSTPHRAADIRTNAMPDSALDALVAKINKTWSYGDGQHQVALAHAVPGNVVHLHIQVRDETHQTG